MNELIWPLHIFIIAGQLWETQIYFPSDGIALWGSTYSFEWQRMEDRTQGCYAL